MQGINYDILNQDKAKNEGEELANEHLDMAKDALEEKKDCRPKYGKSVPTRRVSDLNILEFKDLMVECFEMLKQREIDTSQKEYKRLTEKSGGGNV